MAELLLSAFLDVLFHRLASRDLFNFVRQIQGGVSSELKNWERKLKMIQAVLSDAEDKQLTDESVKMWLDDLQDLAYDAEDILDEFATQALERKLMVEDPDQPGSSTGSKLLKMVPAACFSCFSPIGTIKFNSSMRTKINDITSRLEDLCKQRIELGLQLTPRAGGTSSATAAQKRPPSSSVPTERAVYGRDDDKAKILAMVLSDEPSVANFRVIPIVGMAGVGKTTLARDVYNDRAVEDFKFDIRAWVCVSNDFDVLGISRALLESITCRLCDLKALNDVQIELKKAVNGKKFLLVLDDVWNENYNSWATLKAPFIAGAPNSKIIVTTRNSHVASTMGPIQHYNLKALSNQDCWSIFIMHAFDDRDINAHQISELFRKKVVEKCGGLPLAAATLGGLLRSRRQDAWDELLNSNILANLPQQSDVHPVLRLSYHYLPSYLKRCFTYCAIFPKDYEFTEGELVFLWIAEGIIQQSSKDKELEVWGSECFHDLVSRSIFQPSSSDNSKFVLHDLVHDLAQLVSGEIIFNLEEANKPSRRFERVRHYSYPQGWCDGKNKFELLYEVERLRTFLPLSLNRRFYLGPSYITAAVLYDLLPKFKKLRVLSLEQYYVTELPQSFADLRLLRCLNFAGTCIKSLHESISSLLNLEVLILKDCSHLIKLPTKMRKLIKLRHLDIRGAKLLKEMPWGMKELKNLKTLSNFIVGKGGSVSGLKDLKNLKFLRGELCISGLQNVNDSQDAKEAMLCEKQNIKALSLEWGSQFDISRDEAVEENVLDMLQPQKDLKELTIRYYGGVRFPSWVANPSFSTMEALTLKNCENCTSLPTLGLLSSLKHLVVEGLKKLKSIGVEFYGESCSNPFQALVTLYFEDLPEWEKWDTKFDENGLIAEFCSLCELSIVNCPKFCGKLPEHLPLLEKLVVSKCEELVVSFSSFPKLCKLEIDGCKGLVCNMSPIDAKSVECMTISNSSFKIYGCKGMVYNDSRAANSVTISNLLEFGKFLKQGFQQVEALWIRDSDQIESRLRTEKPGQGLHVITWPEEVSIQESVVRLASFPEFNFFLNNLRSLRIEKAKTKKSLPEEIIGNNSQLESLCISNCDSLTFIARRKLSSSLESLEIWDCKNLQHLVDGEEDDPSLSSSSGTLKRLSIIRCPELTSLSSGIQPLEALEYFEICGCPKLESMPDSLHNLNWLQHIKIYNCASLVSLGERGLPESISNVEICRCEKIEALPSDMHKLNSLRRLSIRDCPSIVSFPEGGFPTSLTSLSIGGDVKVLYKALIQWGLQRLTSLRRLSIDEECHEAECFPDEEIGMMLPTSLTHLEFSGLSELRYLSSKAFQSLTSLEILNIWKCRNLTSFPEVGLPSSLLILMINDCPKLKKECKRGNGKQRSKIASIPYVLIDWKFIYDPDSEE